jgi:hypothetical protein
MIFAQKNIEDFLYTPGKFFEIPEFQRPYSWQSSNIKEFLHDLEECVEKDKNHYFGTVVFVRETNNIDSSAIIDGQQRVTTALLMITAIYHLVYKNSELSNMTAEDIKERYLVNRNAKDDHKNRVKLRTVTTDNTVLQRIFDVEGVADKLTAEEKQSKLYLAYAEFKEYFSTRSELDKYITALTRFEIVTIALDSRDDNPQRVFESINSTGKPLTDGDKIRNFALMLNNEKSRQYVYQKYWKNIEQSLTDVSKDFITDFFRSYIISKKQSLVRMDSVYPEFKKLFYKNINEQENIENIDAFYSDITRMLDFYLLCKFERDREERFTAVKDVVFKMRYIQTELYIPFAMTVLNHYDKGKLNEKELAEAFRLIETYFSRRIVCNIPTTSVDRFLASLHKDIIEHQKDSSDAGYVEVMAYILNSRSGPTRMPSETEFTSAIKNNQTYNQRTAHVNYILAAVDDMSRESSTLKQIASKDLKLSIEHVMPQSLTKEWELELGINEVGIEKVMQLHNQYLHTLANLTLTGYNSEYSNQAFYKKKTMKDGFEDSPLKINKQIATTERWDEQALKKRQNWWIKNLDKVWPIPTTAFQPPIIDTTISLLDDHNLKGTSIRALYMFGDTFPVSSWSETLDTIAEQLYDRNSNFYTVVIGNELLSRFIRPDSSSFMNSAEIYDTGYYVDTGTDTNTKLRLIHTLAESFELEKNDIKAELSKPLYPNIEEFTS